ncbi:GGDEF domain-containing protein [Rhodanobacter panaciterrae]|uniref:diguanylate cyclase n=1 Tax=Rhodanobacter panaciterrae TaxID=490572 RepID=A0ABQ2ZL62_9GAMM|nr:GGDEF domain-containing protein [Rhodanobacter panaciterrae]
MLIGAIGGVALFVGVACAAAPASSSDDAALLQQAETQTCTSSLTEQCANLLHRLEQVSSQLAPEQRQRLRYLQAWQAAFGGNYQKSDALIDGILDESRDADLRFEAAIFRVNSLSEQSRFEEAFRQLSQLVVSLQEGTGIGQGNQERGFAVASSLYAEAGQYELASYYAEEIFKRGLARAGHTCVGDHTRIAALYGGGKWQDIEPLITQGIEVCIKERNNLYANGIRYFAAKLDLNRGHPEQAIALLRKHYPVVQRDGYAPQLAQFDALLATAYSETGQLELARESALAAVAHGTHNSYAEPISTAYRILYQVAKQQGDAASALTYHEQYMVADKGYLDEVSAKALAFQTVQQQVVAKKLQIDTLNKQNQILQLQQSLDKSASETNRLYIILLLTVLAFIVLWTYRIKRSQLRFMKLARRDGLTGIFNRQHFVSSAEQQLQYCKKSARQACLVLIDLDHFKIVNDTHGHAVGDRVLKRAVAACQEHLRSTDIFGRLGGEEFGIVLPECTLDQALGRAEQIRVAIASAASGEDAPGIPISASFGVASIVRSGYELRQLLIDADDGLYRAKREGRNRVSVCDDTQPRQRVAGVATDRA